MSDSPSAAIVAPTRPAVAAPLGYQRGPTRKEVERSDAVIDVKRDIHAPVALLIVGFALYVAYYAIRYDLGGSGIAAVGAGLGIMTAVKAAILVGFAMVVAGPLGVSFGGIGTATLKLAAIAVFTDGVTTWVDAGVTAAGGGAFTGAFGFSMISFPVALGVYWALLIYLFSMDPGDSWIVVIILAVFDSIIRTVLMVVVLNMILGWGGVAGASSALTTNSGATAAELEHITQLKEHGELTEAQEYIAGGRQSSLKGWTDDLYAAGCKNVYFELTPADINGRRSPTGLVLEMPSDPAERAKVFGVLKRYYAWLGVSMAAEDLADGGEHFINVGIR
jgi:hypothetical protein